MTTTKELAEATLADLDRDVLAPIGGDVALELQELAGIRSEIDGQIFFGGKTDAQKLMLLLVLYGIDDRIAARQARLPEQDQYRAWVRQGYERGWSTDIFCETHDLSPMSPSELDEFDAKGIDHCIFCIRVFGTDDKPADWPAS
jgi:hypothetical protein